MNIPALSKTEINEGLRLAKESPRHRYAKVLHKPGAEWNEAFNFLLPNSYMQPHHHPSKEKVEGIYLVEGTLGILFFDEKGTVTQSVILEKGGEEMVQMPAFTWHTYVVLSRHVITYETMRGVYDPATWKGFAAWAPKENTPESIQYLDSLKTLAQKN